MAKEIHVVHVFNDNLSRTLCGKLASVVWDMDNIPCNHSEENVAKLHFAKSLICDMPDTRAVTWKETETLRFVPKHACTECWIKAGRINTEN